MPMNDSEQRLYQSQSPLTILSLGHMRMAIVTGWAARAVKPRRILSRSRRSR